MASRLCTRDGPAGASRQSTFRNCATFSLSSIAAARLSDQFLSTTNRELVLNDLMRVIKSSDVSSDLQLEILLALGSSPRRDTVPVLSELVARGIHSDFHLHALLSAVPEDAPVLLFCFQMRACPCLVSQPM